MKSDTTLQDMQKVRKYCSLGHILRHSLNLPTTYPLYEAHINGDYENGYLTKEYRTLIEEELNIDHVEPFISTFSEYAVIKEIDKDGLKIVIDVSQDHFLQRRYEERKAKSQENQNRKKLGLSYHAVTTL
jgi:hypothetical protein